MAKPFKSRIILLAIVIIAGASVLYYFNPETTILLPKCPFKLLTGWSCPGCGFQRAMHALLHGNIIKALHYNWFLILSLPYLLGLLIGEYTTGGIWHNRIYPILRHYSTIYVYLFSFFCWWILRNFFGI